MISLWNDKDAKAFLNDSLQLRVYASRLLGSQPDLVLHGGGNTSVKIKKENVFGDIEEILYVKASGVDLTDIQPAGFAPVKLSRLDEMTPYKRQFMIAVIDIIANNSYLAEMMSSLGENADGMPLDIKKYLEK